VKILVIVVAGVVLPVLAVVVVGWLLPKGHVVSRSASYQTKPDRLFSLITGPQDWRSDVLRCETVPDANGRELMRETMHDGESISYELLDRVPPTSIKRRIATDNLPYSGTWTFSLQPNGERTIVRITENGEVHTPVFRFMSRFVLGHSRSMDAYLHALGKTIGQEVEVKD
jgi:hypothetical protein